MDLILKWIGVIALMYLFGKLVYLLIRKVGIRKDITWREIFKRK